MCVGLPLPFPHCDDESCSTALSGAAANNSTHSLAESSETLNTTVFVGLRTMLTEFVDPATRLMILVSV